MHLLIATRGYKPDVDRFITELQGKYFPYKCKEGNFAVAMNVQPIQLWSLVFPEENLQQVLNTIKPSVWSKGLNLLLKFPRKLLGLKPIPEIDKNVLPMPIYNKNIEVMPIGIKKDLSFSTGEFDKGEML